MLGIPGHLIVQLQGTSIPNYPQSAPEGCWGTLPCPASHRSPMLGTLGILPLLPETRGPSQCFVCTWDPSAEQDHIDKALNPQQLCPFRAVRFSQPLCLFILMPGGKDYFTNKETKVTGIALKSRPVFFPSSHCCLSLGPTCQHRSCGEPSPRPSWVGARSLRRQRVLWLEPRW